MFTIDELLPVQSPVVPIVTKKTRKPYKQHIHTTPVIESMNTMATTSSIDNILENEKQLNIKDTWNKLDKTMKIVKLNTYAMKYCLENKSELYDSESLMVFFKKSLERNKLQKKKDLVYDKDTNEIVAIPSLCFQGTDFFLKEIDNKRTPTMKSLTPKRKS
jgi:HJR/Mrr/RecB family endonuclease